MAEAGLTVGGLTVRYGAYAALSDFDAVVEPGTILGLIGPNGAGKSSAFAGITASVPRSAGVITLGGRDVSGWSTAQLAGAGLRRTFQQNSFYLEFSVLENAVSALSRARGTGMAMALVAPWVQARRGRDVRAAAAELLRRFGIEQRYFGSPPDKLPYGLQRVLSIALAYADGPRVLLLDEPAAGIGGEDMRHLTRVLRGLREDGLAIMLVEHHMDLLMAVADRVIVIDRGETIAHDRPAVVQRDPKVLEAYLGHAA